MSLDSATKEEGKFLGTRKDRSHELVNEECYRITLCIENMDGDKPRHIPPYASYIIINNCLIWTKKYITSKKRSQTPRQWINTNKARYYGEHFFPKLFESVQQYAIRIAKLYESIDNKEQSLLINCLIAAFFGILLEGTIPSDKKSGLRQLVCDVSFQSDHFIKSLIKLSSIKGIPPKSANKVKRKNYIIKYYKDEKMKYLSLYIKNKIQSNKNNTSYTLQESQTQLIPIEQDLDWEMSDISVTNTFSHTNMNDNLKFPFHWECPKCDELNSTKDINICTKCGYYHQLTI